MFKDIQSGLSKFFTTQRILLLVVFFILVWGLFNYSSVKGLLVDNMETRKHEGGAYQPSPMEYSQPSMMVDRADNGLVLEEGLTTQTTPPNDALNPVANPSDLLPHDSNSQWSALNPNSMNKGDMMMPDLLQAGYHIGLDTIGQSLRNPNYQLRSDPIIPKSNVGPWNQSTIEPDLGRVPLEIGQGPQ